MKRLSLLKVFAFFLLPLISCSKVNHVITLDTPLRPAGQEDVVELRCEPIPHVRIALIGVGGRGYGALTRLVNIPTATVAVVCDINENAIKRSLDFFERKGIENKPDTYTGEDDWREICERDDIDLVYVCTHWALHTPIAIHAMENGKHAAIEVPGALTLDECWGLVNTAEQTRRHCMMLENCNYDFFELATLNMAQKGLFGEIVHCEGAYIHDLRAGLFSPNSWRMEENRKNTGNLYPTHGLGPIAHIMNIHRGDRMERMVTVSTNQFGLTAYAKEKFGENSEQAKTEYMHGDMNVTMIKTAKGKTMMVQHDITSPRPYSRIHLVSGTKGFAQKYPNYGLAFEPDAHSFLPPEKRDSLLKAYEHPIVTEVGELAKQIGGHGGMDFIMDYRLIYCLNNGLPLDMDVYDCAEWCCLTPLSQISLENNNAPVEVPDFTRGAWDRLKTVTYYYK